MHINEIANYYDMPKLVQLANLKIEPTLGSRWSGAAFDGGLQSMSGESTRRHIVELTSKEFAQIHKMRSFTAVLVQYLVEQLYETNRQCKEFNGEFEKSVASSPEETEYEYEYEDLAWSREESLRESIDQCLNVLYFTKSCRNPGCGVDFYCYIEEEGMYSEPRFNFVALNITAGIMTEFNSAPRRDSITLL